MSTSVCKSLFVIIYNSSIRRTLRRAWGSWGPRGYLREFLSPDNLGLCVLCTAGVGCSPDSLLGWQQHIKHMVTTRQKPCLLVLFLHHPLELMPPTRWSSKQLMQPPSSWAVPGPAPWDGGQEKAHQREAVELLCLVAKLQEEVGRLRSIWEPKNLINQWSCAMP